MNKIILTVLFVVLCAAVVSALGRKAFIGGHRMAKTSTSSTQGGYQSQPTQWKQGKKTNKNPNYGFLSNSNRNGKQEQNTVQIPNSEPIAPLQRNRGGTFGENNFEMPEVEQEQYVPPKRLSRKGTFGSNTRF
jgi:hypothetical protein